MPIIPSLILFLALPKNNATVESKIKGLEFKLGGSVAFYFIVFFYINPIKLGLVDTDKTDDDWKLITSFQDESNQKIIPVTEIKTVEPIPTFSPTALDNKKVLLPITGLQVTKDHELKLPYAIRFSFFNYESVSIDASDYFNDDEVRKVDWNTHQIFIKKFPQVSGKNETVKATSASADTLKVRDL